MNKIIREIQLSNLLNEELDTCSDAKKIKDFFDNIFNDMEEIQIQESDNFFYIKNNEKYIKLDLEKEITLCSYKHIWSFFEKEFGYNSQEIRELIHGMLGMYIKRKVFTPKYPMRPSLL